MGRLLFLSKALTIVFAMLTLSGHDAIAQSRELTLDSVLSWAEREHPLAELANSIEQQGMAALMGARGAFDPKVEAGFDRKDYLGTEYFQYAQGGISVQTPYALKIEGGREWASGEFFNPERNVPAAGQAYLSVKLPLLQGLLFDKYRADLAEGELEIDRNRAAAQQVVNELKQDVALAYTQWAYAKMNYNIYAETEQLLSDYLVAVKGLLDQGDKPAVDTLEAAVYLLDQQLLTEQARVELNLAEQDVRALFFPFDESLDQPTQLTYDLEFVAGLTTNLNPELQELNTYLKQLEIKQRLKREYLKPRLDVGYSILGDGFELAPRDDKVEDRSFFTRAYKVGAQFSYPLRNRKARSKVQLATLKLAQTNQKLIAKQQSLSAKAKAYERAFLNFSAQEAEAEVLVNSAQRLLAAERELFDLGESTQFLLNARAQSLQKAKVTQAKAIANRAKAYFTLRYLSAVWN